ncbi:MAG: SDR family oxidoreductase [Acidobacteriota bacterium]
MGKLDGSIAVIAGGTGTVGEGIVRAFLREGATVIVPSRSSEKIVALCNYLSEVNTDNLITLIGNIGEPAGAEKILEEILNRYGKIDAMVASLGGSWEKGLPITKVPIDTWREYWENNLTAHFVAAKVFLPVLANNPGSSYTLLGGLSAVLAIPYYSPVAVNSAGQLMMAKILIEEMKESGVRINQVMFGFINTRERAAYARQEWVTADEVGNFIAYLASKEAYMINGGVIQLGDKPKIKTKTN